VNLSRGRTARTAHVGYQQVIRPELHLLRTFVRVRATRFLPRGGKLLPASRGKKFESGFPPRGRKRVAQNSPRTFVASEARAPITYWNPTCAVRAVRPRDRFTSCVSPLCQSSLPPPATRAFRDRRSLEVQSGANKKVQTVHQCVPVHVIGDSPYG
jgi:hypothetical protein